MALNIEKNIEVLEHQAVGGRRGLLIFLAAILRSRYFLISLLFYVSLLLLFSGYVISTYVLPRGSFDGVDQLLVLPPASQPPPPPPKQKTTAETKEVKVSSVAAKTDAQRITVKNVASPATFVKNTQSPQVAPTVKMAEVKIETDMSTKIKAANIARLQNVKKFQQAWGVTGEKRATKAKFSIFKAKYQNGDWNCNPEDLINLLLQIRRWSKDRLDANMYPEVLDIGTEQLFTLKPPFIYLTGHKDFILKEQEVKNIRDYLMLGGAVWADTALAGRRSRFDIAFRREMKRVLPDRDFEDVPPDHEMFDTFFDRIGLPSGINFYQEPIEKIDIGNELAVLYTLNGYGHFWESRLNREGKIEWGRINVSTNAGKPIWRHVYGPHLGGHGPITRPLYRNINDETVRNAYKFGINVVVHLLTRYQKYFKLLPVEKAAAPTEFHGRPEEKPKEAAEGEEGAPAVKAPPAPVHKSFDKLPSGMTTNRPSGGMAKPEQGKTK